MMVYNNGKYLDNIYWGKEILNFIVKYFVPKVSGFSTQLTEHNHFLQS